MLRSIGLHGGRNVKKCGVQQMSLFNPFMGLQGYDKAIVRGPLQNAIVRLCKAIVKLYVRKMLNTNFFD